MVLVIVADQEDVCLLPAFDLVRIHVHRLCVLDLETIVAEPTDLHAAILEQTRQDLLLTQHTEVILRINPLWVN
jgi:hypothetical protein